MKLNLVDATLILNGENTHFVSLKLFQKFNAHHRCEIVIDMEELDKSFMNDPVKIIKNIGESLTIEMKHRDTNDTNVFRGIITNITMSGKHGQKGYVHIHAASETIRLEGQPTMDSFVNKTLADIVYEVVNTSGNGAEVTIKPTYNKTIEYLSQWEESGHQFLNRLSSLYGEAYYNDGTTTYFGLPNLDDAIPIKYDAELTSLNVNANLLPANFGYYNYIVEDDQEWQKQTRDSTLELTGYQKVVADKSDSFYTSKAMRPLHANVGDSDSIMNMADTERTKNVSDMLTLNGTSQTCKIGIGKVIYVVYPEHMKVTTSAGNFLITEITHEFSQEGHYSNTFSGVRAALERIPVPKIAAPIASSQRAIVVSNTDPSNWGRIQVRFLWQNFVGKTTNWIRVQTMNGGGTAAVPKNRGFVFIPEPGDEVIINFENDDPSKPYCSGSLFPTSKSEGGKVENAVKSIMTRSGIKIIFNDFQKSLHIEDASGNKWDLDGEGNVRVYAPKKIQFSSNDLDIDVRNDLTFNVGKNIITNALGSSVTTTPYLKQLVSGRIDMYSTESILYSDSYINLESKKVTAIGKDKLFLHSEKETTVNSKGTAYMHGANKTSYTNTPLDNEESNSPPITDVVIEFRPDDSYKGEFGFDYLRVNDDGLETEPLYKTILDGAYNSKQDESMHTGEKAYNVLKSQYENVTIKNEAEPYFVPYLNIYPATAKGTPNPPSTVKLRMLKKTKIDVEKIIIEFEDEFFKINGSDSPYSVKDILINKDKSKKEINTDKPLNITCIKEFGTPKFLKVYAYPTPKKDAPSPQRLFAGQLCVCPNAKQFRKTQKIVIVPLKMNTGLDDAIGEYLDNEITNLKKILYQALVYADVEVKPALNLTNIENFKPMKKYNLPGSLYIQNKDAFPELYADLRSELNKVHKGLENDIVIFLSPMELALPASLGGNVRNEYYGFTNMIIRTLDDGSPDISFKKDILLFPVRLNKAKLKTMAHESGHALGLFHTWVEETEDTGTETQPDGSEKEVRRIWNDKKLFVFGSKEGDKVTNNLMSYSDEANTLITWKWQWDIIHGR